VAEDGGGTAVAKRGRATECERGLRRWGHRRHDAAEGGGERAGEWRCRRRLDTGESCSRGAWRPGLLRGGTATKESARREQQSRPGHRRQRRAWAERHSDRA